MAMVPKYTSRASVPGGTGMQGIPLSLATSPLSNVGEGLTKVSGALEAAGTRIQNRADVISRARDLASVNKEIGNAYAKWQTEDDGTDPNAIERFGVTASEFISNAVKNHAGSADSKAMLEARLEGLRMQYGSQASIFALNQQQELVDQTIAERVGALAARVAADPRELPAAFASLKADIADMAPALTPGKEAKSLRQGESLIIRTAVQTMIDKGSVAEAKNLLDTTPNIGQILDPNDGIKLRSAIAKYEVEEFRAKNKGNLALRTATQILGYELSEQQREKLAGVDLSGTLSGRIVAIEERIGPLNPEQIKRLAKIDGGDFGSGLMGRSLSIITDDAPSFAAGLLEPNADRRYLAAVNQYTQPVTAPNPDTGVLETRSPTLPQFVVEALQRRGLEVPNSKPPGIMEGAGRTPSQGTTTLTGGKTIFELAGKVTGPVPAAMDALGKVPIVGEFINSPEMTQARNAITASRRDYIKSMQNNPKYAEGERKAIEDETNIDFSIIDTPAAFKNRLIGIDDALAVRESNSLKTAQNKNVPVEERKQALATFNTIQNFRLTLGVPPRVKSVEEVKKLPAGSPFIDPYGVIRRAPGG
jgi:hypothetical protein